jgi:hypothetical protein
MNKTVKAARQKRGAYRFARKFEEKHKTQSKKEYRTWLYK